MKRVILIVGLLVGLTFAQGRVATHPVWHGFQLIGDNVDLSTTRAETSSFRASELLGVGTLWIETTASYSGTVTCEVEVKNNKTGSWAIMDAVTFTNLADGGNAVKFNDAWVAADSAKFNITLSTGSITVDVYVGTE